MAPRLALWSWELACGKRGPSMLSRALLVDTAVRRASGLTQRQALTWQRRTGWQRFEFPAGDGETALRSGTLQYAGPPPDRERVRSQGMVPAPTPLRWFSHGLKGASGVACSSRAVSPAGAFTASNAGAVGCSPATRHRDRSRPCRLDLSRSARSCCFPAHERFGCQGSTVGVTWGRLTGRAMHGSWVVRFTYATRQLHERSRVWGHPDARTAAAASASASS